MAVLVLGATGATGKQVVKSLLNKGETVKVIVRSLDRLMPEFVNHDKVIVTLANVHQLSENDMKEQLHDCTAVVSCLGHNLTFRGIYGHPRCLVSDVTTTVCQAIKKLNPSLPIKFILMSTTGYQNHLQNEQVSLKHQAVIALLRCLLPPHVDNEKAANYLLHSVTQSTIPVEWVAVRPDSLVDQESASAYEVYPSPLSDPIFQSQQTSRINVARFMVDLLNDAELWNRWKSKTPVLYNKV
ncbi:NAD(P)-binding oxidoreductase [Vibrio sp. WJH972]